LAVCIDISSSTRFDTNTLFAGLVKKNMGKTSELSSEQEALMLQKTPENLKPEAQKLAARRKAAFDKATAAFAQSVGGEDKADGEDDSD
jgi:hypothetical protein